MVVQVTYSMIGLLLAVMDFKLDDRFDGILSCMTMLLIPIHQWTDRQVLLQSKDEQDSRKSNTHHLIG